MNSRERRIEFHQETVLERGLDQLLNRVVDAATPAPPRNHDTGSKRCMYSIPRYKNNFYCTLLAGFGYRVVKPPLRQPRMREAVKAGLKMPSCEGNGHVQLVPHHWRGSYQVY